ncbi:hypothetical protein SAMN04487968_102342 [Nocardioides terrae]|uniref:Uncharacterized protein n=1 Tax=Nocardioides terrae TaxID=574651 RepID=A0A1I1F636_9ACTN|nr:hypothetical protein SAMN04487968_102342 [Nocardioides terrae]
MRTVVLGLGSLLLLVGTVAGVVNREVLDADRFAAHADAVRTDPDVARQLGRLLTTRILREQPDLVALRPLVEATATGVVSSSALGPLVRRSVSPLYNALLLGDDDPVVLRLADAAAVVVAGITALAPQSTVALPADLDVRLSDIGAGTWGTTAVAPVHLVRLLSWLAPLLALLLLITPGLLGPRERRLRTVAVDVGRGMLAAGAGLAALLVLTAAVVGRADRDTLDGAVRAAVWDQLAGRFWATAAVTVGVGLLLTLVSAPRTERSRTLLWATLAIVLGLALVTDPARVALALLWVVGLGLLVGGVGTALVTLAHAPVARTWALVAAVVLLVGVVVGAWPGDHHLQATRAVSDSEGCNGHVELCDRRYDEVAFPATHNSMAAASEPGWFFPEQPDGIVDQLDAGIRALLIDSWYGRATDRPSVVTTVGEARDRAVAEADQAFGASSVASALRLVGAAGLNPRGPQESYLCHGLCEIGSTSWASSLTGMRSWLDAHPREVVTLVVQDEVSPADTAALIEQAGLLPDVYEPVAGDPWPTLGQMVESGKRLVVLMERHGGGSAYPWLLQGFDWIQDTPFLFRTPAALIDGPDTCALNRGHADAPLLLLNHWVTDKSAEVTNAGRVNAASVLGTRADACRKERGMLPNFVAVDFYDQGDLFGVVDRLNGFG